MIGDKAESHIKFAVRDEMTAAIENHGEFHSHHEAWAVLREEVQEVMECFTPFDRTTDSAMDKMWDLVKHDAVDGQAEELIENIYDIAEELTKECIQVMAVCQKWLRLIKKEREEYE